MRTRINLFLFTLMLFAGNTEVHGGHFFSDFNHGVPSHCRLLGTATVESFGGYDNTGMLQLTDLQSRWVGTMILDPLDENTPVASFIVTYKAFIGGGTGADGMGLHFGNLPNVTMGEDPRTNELAVTFDTYKNNRSEVAPGIRVSWARKLFAQVSVPHLQANRFVDVLIKLDPDGTLDVAYDGKLVVSNVFVGATNVVGRFAFGGRVGSMKDYHLVDDLEITTQTAPRAFVDTFGPNGDDASPSPLIEVRLKNFGTDVNPNSIHLRLDDKLVEAEVSEARRHETRISYEPETLLAPGSIHRVAIDFEDFGYPPVTNRFSYEFKVSSDIIVFK